jgi:hypothetical protein
VRCRREEAQEALVVTRAEAAVYSDSRWVSRLPDVERELAAIRCP